MTYVIVINGKPGSGKDTFVSMCRTVCMNNGTRNSTYGRCHHYSSVTPIKDICRMLGWDGEKTEYWRKVISMLKRIWVKSCNGPTRYMMNLVMQNIN